MSLLESWRVSPSPRESILVFYLSAHWHIPHLYHCNLNRAPTTVEKGQYYDKQQPGLRIIRREIVHCHTPLPPPTKGHGSTSSYQMQPKGSLSAVTIDLPVLATANRTLYMIAGSKSEFKCGSFHFFKTHIPNIPLFLLIHIVHFGLGRH